MNDEKDTQNQANEMFSQAAKFFQNAFEAGIKMQQQSTKSLTEMIGNMNAAPPWQAQAQSAMEQMVETAEAGINDAMELMSENTRTGLELLEKAFQARQDLAKGEAPEQSREMWETAIGSFTRNTEVVLQANSRMLDSWRKMAATLQNGHAEKQDDKVTG